MRRLLYSLFILVVAGYTFCGAWIYRAAAASGNDDLYQQMELFVRVLERVRKDYVDGEKLTYKELVQGAMKGMLNTLDPHSEFMDLTKFQELREDTEGTYGGIGLQVGAREGGLVVIAPMEDSPAFEAGIMSGDRLVQIDGQSCEKFSQTDAVRKLRGEAGTKVRLSVSRPSFPEPKDYELTRADIRVYTVKDINNRREFPLGADGVGYIRLTQFGEKSAGELEEALVKLEAQGMKGMVLDLRGNPGGLLDQAVLICEKFLEKGKPIVSTEARSKANEVHRSASNRGKIRGLPMVILVNRGSASASEIVAGCFQDLKRSIIVGEQTFGKGSVQSILPLQDGSALRLTTAKYYTPSHKVIHEKGITPDILVTLTDDEETAIQLRRLPGGESNIEDALRNFDPERRAILRDLAMNSRDAQLERATDLLKGIHLFVKRNKADERPAEKPPVSPVK